MELMIIFFGSMSTVFLLGINSQLVRDKNCSGAFVIAWLITLSNMMYTKTFVLSDSFVESYVASGTGGSIGIVLSIIFYQYLESKKSEKLKYKRK